jgi:hypothetical protein
VGEAVEIVALDLPCGLSCDVDTVVAGDRDRARIGFVTEVVGRGSGGIDKHRKAARLRCQTKRAFGHR